MIEQTCTEIAQSASDKYYFLGFVIGSVLTYIASCLYPFFLHSPEAFNQNKRMFSSMQFLMNRNDGIVTVIDLVIVAKVPPEKATKFLASFARKLEVEPEVEETVGTRFYRFSNSRQVAKRLGKDV